MQQVQIEMSEEIEKREVRWYEYHRVCLELVEKIHNGHPEITKIVAVSRGGFVAAAILAHELNLPIDHSLVPPRDSKPTVTYHHNDVVVVDEICDTGKTFTLLRDAYPRALFAATYCKPEGFGICGVYARECAQATWLRFPWERE